MKINNGYLQYENKISNNNCQQNTWLNTLMKTYKRILLQMLINIKKFNKMTVANGDVPINFFSWNGDNS